MSIKNLLPWDITDKHPVTVPVLIGWNIISAIKEIYKLALVEEIFQSMGSTISFNDLYAGIDISIIKPRSRTVAYVKYMGDVI